MVAGHPFMVIFEEFGKYNIFFFNAYKINSCRSGLDINLHQFHHKGGGGHFADRWVPIYVNGKF